MSFYHDAPGFHYEAIGKVLEKLKTSPQSQDVLWSMLEEFYNQKIEDPSLAPALRKYIHGLSFAGDLLSWLVSKDLIGCVSTPKLGYEIRREGIKELEARNPTL